MRNPTLHGLLEAFTRDAATRLSLATAQGDEIPFEVVESDGGLLIGARRNADGGHYYWRITQWIMPCVTMIPPRANHPCGGHFWVPIDDENCWVWNWDYCASRPLTAEEISAMKNCAGRHVIYEPGSFRADGLTEALRRIREDDRG